MKNTPSSRHSNKLAKGSLRVVVSNEKDGLRWVCGKRAERHTKNTKRRFKRRGAFLWVYIVFFSNIRVETLVMLFEHVIFGLKIFVAAGADDPGIFAVVAGFSSTSFDLFWAEDHEVWESISTFCSIFRLANKNV